MKVRQGHLYKMSFFLSYFKWENTKLVEKKQYMV